MSPDDQPPPSLDDLSDQHQPGIVAEFVDFLKHNKKWWLLPILLVIAIVGLLAAFAGSGAAPFIYTLF